MNVIVPIYFLSLSSLHYFSLYRQLLHWCQTIYLQWSLFYFFFFLIFNFKRKTTIAEYFSLKSEENSPTKRIKTSIGLNIPASTPLNVNSLRLLCQPFISFNFFIFYRIQHIFFFFISNVNITEIQSILVDWNDWKVYFHM